MEEVRVPCAGSLLRCLAMLCFVGCTYSFPKISQELP